ncbi:MAG: DUF4245 domain-containing protein [Nocardioidaceae bacterium]
MSDSDPRGQAAPRRQARGNPGLSDMVRSVVVLLAVVGVLAVLHSLLQGNNDRPAPTVDYHPALAQARKAAPYPVLAPVELPVGWRATSVSYTPGDTVHWHLGVLTTTDDYIGIDQERMATSEVLANVAPPTQPSGSVMLAGVHWQVRSSSSGESTLVSRRGGITTVVTGNLPLAQVEAYVGSLRSR